MDGDRRKRLEDAAKACLLQSLLAGALWFLAPNPFFLRDLLSAAALLSLGMLLALHFIIEAWGQVHTVWKPSAEFNPSGKEWQPSPSTPEGKATPELMLRSFRAARVVSRAALGGLCLLFLLRLGGCLLHGYIGS